MLNCEMVWLQSFVGFPNSIYSHYHSVSHFSIMLHGIVHIDICTI